MGIVTVGKTGNKVMGAGQPAGVLQLLIGGIRIAPAQVVFDRTGEQHVFLQHHGYLVPEGLDIVIPDIHAADFDCAIGGVV